MPVKRWRLLAGILLLLPLASALADDAPETPEQAQMREARASLYQGSLKAALAMLRSLDAIGAEAAAEQATIREDADMFQKGENIFEATVAETKTKRDQLAADVASYEAALVPHNVMVDNHNARCGKVFGPKETAAFQKCQQELAALQPLIDQKKKDKDALAARIAAQEAEESKLAQQAQDLEAIRAKLVARVAANESKGQDYLAKRAKFISQIEEFRSRLLALQASYDACKSALADRAASDETVHDVCGKAFDGNRVPDSYLPDDERKPKWSPWGDT
jgi:chromosome segregation ATPase